MPYAKINNEPILYSIESDNYETTYNELPAGTYLAELRQGLFGPITKFTIHKPKEELIEFDEGIVKDIIVKAEGFLEKSNSDMYKEMSLTHKMGMLLHGPHGTGKTCTAVLAMKILSEKYNAICLFMENPTEYYRGMPSPIYKAKTIIEAIRKKQNNPVVIFIDEVERSFKNHEEDYLTFLDGHNSLDDVIFLGCTNFLNKIPERIKDRKSRIKHVFEIRAFPISVYKFYIKQKLKNISEDRLAEFAYKAEEAGLTIDQVKHAVIDYAIENYSIEESIKNVQHLKDEIKPKEEENED